MSDVVERLRMVCAEVGYPNAYVCGPDEDPSIRLYGTDGVPDRVCWKAFATVGLDQACWECWRRDLGESCPADRPGVEDCGVERPS